MELIKIQDILSDYFNDELGIAIEDVYQDLFKSGAVDSFNLIQIFQFIEDRFGVEIDMEELEISNFKSINSIANQISAWLKK